MKSVVIGYNWSPKMMSGSMMCSKSLSQLMGCDLIAINAPPCSNSFWSGASSELRWKDDWESVLDEYDVISVMAFNAMAYTKAQMHRVERFVNYMQSNPEKLFFLGYHDEDHFHDASIQHLEELMLPNVSMVFNDKQAMDIFTTVTPLSGFWVNYIEDFGRPLLTNDEFDAKSRGILYMGRIHEDNKRADSLIRVADSNTDHDVAVYGRAHDNRDPSGCYLGMYSGDVFDLRSQFKTSWGVVFGASYIKRRLPDCKYAPRMELSVYESIRAGCKPTLRECTLVDWFPRELCHVIDDDVNDSSILEVLKVANQGWTYEEYLLANSLLDTQVELSKSNIETCIKEFFSE